MRHFMICDIDGTISDCQWRRHMAERARKATDPEERNEWWNRFHAASSQDKPFVGERQLVCGWEALGHGIIYLTGRTDTYRQQTAQWLWDHGFPKGELLLMRPAVSRARSSDFKRGQLRYLVDKVLTNDDRISIILEDDDHCVAMWREMGLTCLQPRTTGY